MCRYVSVKLLLGRKTEFSGVIYVPEASSPISVVVHAADELMVFMTFMESDSVSL